MKRSEMVINIAIELMSNFPELKKEERRKIADEILQCIEINGMLPPPKTVDVVTNFLVYCYYPQVIGDDTDHINRVNSQLWEPEDAVS